ncbi:unnamed protein product [Ixodes persulcatus]
MALGVPVVCSVGKTVDAAEWSRSSLRRAGNSRRLAVGSCRASPAAFFFSGYSTVVGAASLFLEWIALSSLCCFLSVWFVPDFAVFVFSSGGSGFRSVFQGLILHCCCFLSRGSDAIPVTPS